MSLTSYRTAPPRDRILSCCNYYTFRNDRASQYSNIAEKSKKILYNDYKCLPMMTKATCGLIVG